MVPRTTPVKVAAAVTAAILLASCAGFQYRYAADAKVRDLLSKGAPAYPQARFLVISDPHMYDTALGTDGKAYRDALMDDRKLISEADEILRTAMGLYADLKPQFLVVSGDLTKDGERASHELFARRMAEARAAGVRVYVVPGNHDIWNPEAYRYIKDGKERTPDVSPEDFAAIYRDCGYGDAVARDAGSLSYVAEPVPGLRLLAIDSCDYADNPKRKSEQTNGRLTQKRLDWIEGVLADSAAKGKAVIAFQHHGLVEHFRGEDRHFGEYMVDDFQEISRMLAAYNVRVVFTGHHHAQDIALQRWPDGRALYDVQTGSLVTPPCAVRLVSVDASQRMAIRSYALPTIPSFRDAGRDFSGFGRTFVGDRIAFAAVKTMVGLGVPEPEAKTLAPQIGDAFNAYYRGDERFTGTEMLKTSGLSLMGWIVVSQRKDLVEELWNDPEPADNDIDIDLATGAWKPAGK